MQASLLRIAGDGPAKTETFSVWVPAHAQLVKSEGATEEDKPWLVNGLSSSEDPDQESETIIQKGLDFNPLLELGHINWDHLPGPGNLIGVPLQAELRDTKNGFGLWALGELYKSKRVAKEAWEHLLAVEEAIAKSRPYRQLGWSVEGGIVARDPYNRSKITKSIVRHLALTGQPVNKKTYAEVVKSLGKEWMRDEQFDPDTNVHYAFGDFDSFAKSMTGKVMNTFDASPLNLQNLDTGKTQDILLELGSRCEGNCDKEKLGRRKALRHLVQCKGMGEVEAFHLVKSLVNYLT